MERNILARNDAPDARPHPRRHPPSVARTLTPRDGRPGSANAFSEHFLDRLRGQDEPSTALAAAREGPWKVAPNGHGRWAVFREGEGFDAGDVPAALFDERHRALLAAAALPGAARRDTLALDPRRLPGGYSLTQGGQTVGRLAWFDAELVGDLAALQAIVSSPRSLALVMAAAGHEALEQAGRVLARLVESAEAPGRDQEPAGGTAEGQGGVTSPRAAAEAASRP